MEKSAVGRARSILKKITAQHWKFSGSVLFVRQ